MVYKSPATIVLVGILAALPGTAAAQATVAGIVWDSLAKAPLPRAIVQLVHADSLAGRSVVSDSLGYFRFDAVAPARYRIGFIHPMLDSLGLDPIVRETTIAAAGPARVDVAIPSPARLRTAMCGAKARAVITGFVRDARDQAPIAKAAVAADWLEMTFQKGGITRVIPRADVLSAANGWFALCNVPSDGLMGLFAAHAGDTSDVLDVSVPPEGFLRHDLYVGRGRGGTLSGTVRSGTNGQVIGGAQVSVAGGTPVRANASGEWTLTDLPMGTRVLEVRAVGFYPERRAVDVTNASPSVRTSLSSFRAVLDTVRVRAARMQDRHESGFEERRRRGNGVFITAQDIQRKGVHTTAEIFRGVRGVRFGFTSDTLMSDFTSFVDPDSLKTTSRQILMRGVSGDVCAPSIFFNGVYVDRVDADDLDAWATPKEISAIEIYSEATLPAQFQRYNKACGAIVIWTRR